MCGEREGPVTKVVSEQKENVDTEEPGNKGGARVELEWDGLGRRRSEVSSLSAALWWGWS